MGPRTTVAVVASVAALGLLFSKDYKRWAKKNRGADLALAGAGVLGFFWAMSADSAERLASSPAAPTLIVPPPL